ncbi:hypothetical protein D3C85_801790 [compost metagenome]
MRLPGGLVEMHCTYGLGPLTSMTLHKKGLLSMVLGLLQMRQVDLHTIWEVILIPKQLHLRPITIQRQ